MVFLHNVHLKILTGHQKILSFFFN